MPKITGPLKMLISFYSRMIAGWINTEEENTGIKESTCFQKWRVLQFCNSKSYLNKNPAYYAGFLVSIKLKSNYAQSSTLNARLKY